MFRISICFTIYGASLLLLADEPNTKISVPPLVSASGITQAEASAVIATAELKIKKLLEGEVHTIWLLPKVSAPATDDPFKQASPQVFATSLGVLRNDDVTLFVDSLKRPESLSAWDVGASWTWVPLLQKQATTPDLANNEFHFVGDKLCWRIRSYLATGAECWADLVYPDKPSLWLKARLQV